jgi:hypothetical protein
MQAQLLAGAARVQALMQMQMQMQMQLFARAARVSRRRTPVLLISRAQALP